MWTEGELDWNSKSNRSGAIANRKTAIIWITHHHTHIDSTFDGANRSKRNETLIAYFAPRRRQQIVVFVVFPPPPLLATSISSKNYQRVIIRYVGTKSKECTGFQRRIIRQTIKGCRRQHGFNWFHETHQYWRMFSNPSFSRKFQEKFCFFTPKLSNYLFSKGLEPINLES